MDRAPFFILIKTFVGTTASEVLMNEFLSSILKKKIGYLCEKIIINKES